MDTKEYPGLHPIYHKYASDLQAYKREYLRIYPQRLKGSFAEDRLGKTANKFGGKPFFPKEAMAQYPKDSSDRDMYLLAQFNLNELPRIPEFPVEGLLQFYASFEHWEEGGFQVRYWNRADLTQDAETNFAFLQDFPLHESIMQRVHGLQIVQSIDWVGLTDTRFTYNFGGDDIFEIRDSLPGPELLEYSNQIDPEFKLGGYGSYLQEDPREWEPSLKDHLLLFQLGDDDECIEVGGGRIHFLISPDDLKALRFDDVYVNMEWG